MALTFNTLTYGSGTLVPNPSRGYSKKSEPKVNRIQFGDGYTQRVAAGINNLKESWSLSWTNIPTDAALAIVSFLEARAGVEYFLWIPPDSTTTYKVICASWDVEYVSHIAHTVTCDFERVYDL